MHALPAALPHYLRLERCPQRRRLLSRVTRRPEIVVPLDQDAGVVAWWGFHLWLGGDRAALVLLRWRPNICAERIGGQG